MWQCRKVCHAILFPGSPLRKVGRNSYAIYRGFQVGAVSFSCWAGCANTHRTDVFAVTWRYDKHATSESIFANRNVTKIPPRPMFWCQVRLKKRFKAVRILKGLLRSLLLLWLELSNLECSLGECAIVLPLIHLINLIPIGCSLISRMQILDDPLYPNSRILPCQQCLSSRPKGQVIISFSILYSQVSWKCFQLYLLFNTSFRNCFYYREYESESDEYFWILTSSVVGCRWPQFAIYKGTNLLVSLSFFLFTESATHINHLSPVVCRSDLFDEFAVCLGMRLGLTFFFLIGAACPVILWMITRRYPNTILNYLKSVSFINQCSYCWHINASLASRKLFPVFESQCVVNVNNTS